MILTLTRTGGFTGIPLKKTVDTTKLSKKESKAIEGLLQQTQETSAGKEKKLPDQFVYSLSTGEGAVAKIIRIQESSLQPEAKNVIQNLLTSA